MCILLFYFICILLLLSEKSIRGHLSHRGLRAGVPWQARGCCQLVIHALPLCFVAVQGGGGDNPGNIEGGRQGVSASGAAKKDAGPTGMTMKAVESRVDFVPRGARVSHRPCPNKYSWGKGYSERQAKFGRKIYTKTRSSWVNRHSLMPIIQKLKIKIKIISLYI
jgi:hypothetical protein